MNRSCFLCGEWFPVPDQAAADVRQICELCEKELPEVFDLVVTGLPSGTLFVAPDGEVWERT
jgi:hypothetical protein